MLLLNLITVIIAYLSTNDFFDFKLTTKVRLQRKPMMTWKILGYAGLIPFFGCLILSTSINNIGINSQQVFIAYSAIILSFIAGSLWRIDEKNTYKKQQLISNLFSVIGFAALCINDLAGLVLLATSYPLILAFEYKIARQTSIRQHYMKMRAQLTVLVFLAHILAIYLWHC